MYTHILLPTDGSKTSEQAAAAGLELARAVGARVTVLHVVPEPAGGGLDAWAHDDPAFQKKLAKALEKRAAVYVENVDEMARKAGVKCECDVVRGQSAHAEILAQARDRGCDLIVMASHGPKGNDSVLLGSETVKVATLGDIPVLIHHPRKVKRRP